MEYAHKEGELEEEADPVLPVYYTFKECEEFLKSIEDMRADGKRRSSSRRRF